MKLYRKNILSRLFDRNPQSHRVNHPPQRRTHFEVLEPRILLSADFVAGAAGALADGLDLFDNHLDTFLGDEALLGERIPMLLTAGIDGDGNPVYEAPTIDCLFTVPVDADGNGYVNGPNPFNTGDDDEAVLDDLDTSNDGQVDVNEFLEAWFFKPVSDWLRANPGASTETFTDFLKGDLLFTPDLDHYLDHLSNVYLVNFEIIDAQVANFTQDPDAQISFSVGFELSITQTLPIDLGLEADALKLLAFTGSADNPQMPTVPVTSTLSFGFDFGVFTGGEATVDQNDFFIRSADPLVLSVTAHDADLDFNFNIGFLGAQVVNGSLDLQADIVTTLLDPNDPDVLGFVDSQHGAEQTGGVVTAANPLADPNLAHEAGFFLRIGNVGINKTVTVADTEAADWTVLKGNIETALSAAGLDGLINVSLVDTDSDTVADSVQFSLVSTSDTPLGFANESLGLAGVISATPDGDGPNIYEYTDDETFLLSVGGAIPQLVTVKFADPSHTDIGLNDDQEASVPRLEALSAPTVYDISGDADFTVTVWKADGSAPIVYSFTLTDTDTDGNFSAGSLASDINTKLNGSPIDTLVEVTASIISDRIRFSVTSEVIAIRVEASGTATSEIGFASDTILGLQLLAANDAVADLSDEANFKLTLNDAGTISTYAITVPDNDRGTLGALAADINAAIDAAVGADRINVVVISGKILLAGNDTNVRSFSVKTINQDINDLIADVNRALDQAGLGGVVTASTDGTLLILTSSGGQSLEISRTLTFDAGVTYAELVATATENLFDATKGDASHVELMLPVQVLPGLEDATTPADDDWQPANVAIVGNFSPFDADSTIAEYNAVEKRFDLNFTFDPETSVPAQDSSAAVPAISALTDEIRLVNMAEPLNFNLVTPESMVGLLMGLGTALQQIANTGLFAGYDIPFADAALADLLNYTDADKAAFSGLIDLLIFDTGGDGIDGVADTDRLVKKIVDAGGTSYLIPAFTTAQTLASRLNALLGVPLEGAGGINATYDKVSNKLTYEVELIGGGRTTVAFDAPFEYDVDLNPFAKLTLDTTAAAEAQQVAMQGYTGLSMTFGIDLSPPGAVIYGDTALAALNGMEGIKIKLERAVTGEAGVRTVLSKNADIHISVNGDTGAWIEVLASDTGDNKTVQDFADDINLAIGRTAYAGIVEAGVKAGRLMLTAVDGTSVLRVHASSEKDASNKFANPAWTELGFTPYFVEGTTVMAVKAPTPMVGRLTGTATFDVDILTNAAGDPDLAGPVSVTINASDTAANRTAADLAADVNNALVTAGLGGLIKASYDVSGTLGTRLVLSALDPDVEFTVANANAQARDEFGLPAGATTADLYDFVIYDSAGGEYFVALDSLVGDTVQELIDHINASTGGAVVADFNATHTGLRLVDTTAGSGQFRVESINASSAMITLGFFGAGNEGTQNQFGDGDPTLIEGGPIGQTHLDDRFFVRDAELWGGLGLQTPEVSMEHSAGGIPGTALFGIVGVDTNLKGSLYAEFTADLQNPVSQVPGSEVTLAQLFAKTNAVAEPAVTETYELRYAPAGFPTDFAPGTMVYAYDVDSPAIIGSAFVLANDAAQGILTVASVKGSFAGAEGIVNVKSANLLDSTKIALNTGGAAAQMESFGEFNLHVDVQPGFDDIGFVDGDGVTSGFGLLDGKDYDVGFKITGFGNPFDPAPPVATFDDLAGDTGDLYAFKDLDYADIGSALHGLQVLLSNIDANFALFNQDLPAITKSVSDLLSLVDGFERGVTNIDEAFVAALLALDPEAVDLPALRLQDIPNALRGAFGLPVGVDPGATDAVDFVTLDFDKADNMLLVDLNLHESIDTKLGLDIDLPGTLPNLTSGGVLKVNGALDMNLNVGIDLAAPNNAYLFDTSNIAAELHVEGEGQTYAGGEDGMGLVFRASLGPLAVFIQDGDALIDVAFALPGLDFGSGIHKKLISAVDFDPADTDDPDDFLDAVITENQIDIVLPMFFGGEGPNDYLGDFKASGNLSSLSVTTPDFSGIEADILSGTIEFDPFENIMLAIDTVNFYLEGLSDILAGDVLGLDLPFIGDQMADILFLENFRNSLYSTLKNGVANAINPDPDALDLDGDDFITNLLQAALGSYLIGDVDYDFDLTSGNISNWYRQWNFTLGGTDYITLTDFDLGIPGLDFDVDTPVRVEFNWEIDLGFGVNFVEGAYIDVSDFDGDGTDLALDLTVTLPQLAGGGSATGWLGFLQLDVTDPGDDTGAILNFDVNVQKGTTSDSRLGFSDLGSINPVTTLKGTALDGGSNILSLHLNGEMAGIGVLPRVSTNLEVDWSLQTGGGDGVALSGLTSNPVLAGLEEIAYTGMSMDGGSIVTDFLAPIFDKIHEIIQPFMPVVDVLTAPIPVLSDLAGEPFTLLDLADIFGSVDADFIEAVADILVLIDKFTAPGVLPVDMPLGDLILYSTTVADAGFDPFDPDFDLSTIDPALLGLDLSSFNTAVALSPLLNGLATQEFAKDLMVPILTDGFQSIGLLFGRNAVLVDYALPPLGVEFEYLQVFPIWGPLAVSIEISFGFTVDLHSVGFDSFGLERYADGGFRNPAVIFDGFYLNDLNSDGVDDPEVIFEFGLVGAAELNLGIARAGVGGGIDALITFNWYDPIADGRVHISELIANVETADPGPNPLAVFDIGGALTFQLFAFLEISILGIEEEFPITPETELLSFNETFNHHPILATDIGGGVLQLNMGPNAKDRIYGDISDGHESITVNWVSGNTVEVGGTEFGGITHIVGIGGQGNDTITLNLGSSGITYELEGGVGDDIITVIGGTGKGTIIGGVGNDTIQGGDGNDTIYGGEGNDIIRGGGGQDIIFGDQGRNVPVSAYVTTPYITSRVTLADGADELHGEGGDDIIIGGGGDDKLWGDAGNDILIGDGGRFEYTPAGPDGHIDVASLRPAAYVAAEVYTEDPDTPAEISAAIDAIYDALMASFHATDLSFGGNDQMHGGDNDDMMFGGSGDDIMEGDAGDDIILGGKGFDEIYGGTKGSAITLSDTVTDKDTIFGGDQADTISGNEDADVISGGSGNDYIHGNAGNDVMKGDSGADIMFGDEDNDQIFGLTEPDILFGGAGDDLVVGGTGNDIMFGDDGLVAKLDPNDSSIGLKVIYNDLLISPAIRNSLLAAAKAIEGEFSDDDIRTMDLILTYVTTEDGNDIMSGEAADDIMLGGGGNDLMGGDVDPRLPDANANGPTDISEDVLIGDGGMITFDQRRFRSISTVLGPVVGTNFDDTLYGDNGNDYLFGGWGNDFLFGGHGKVVDISQGIDGVGAFRGATDDGASDNDIIVGDNGEIIFAGYSPLHPDNFGIKELIRTTDTSNSTGGHDYAEGELGSDVIFGGVNGSVDVLYGNAGDDVILGDNGELDFAYAGDTNLDTLDLIRSYRDGLGGTDIISGLQGNDVLIGGTGGDEMYGDDATASSGAADGEDIMLGDNADIFLIDTVGRLKVQVAEMTTGTAVDRIKTTDSINLGDLDFDEASEVEAAGGADTMSGNAGNDIMLGGVNNGGQDVMYGDRAVPDATTIAHDGNDILLGDNGELRFTLPGGVNYDNRVDTDRMTLDLIRSYRDSLGGTDFITGNKGQDVAIGGTGGDTIYGDDASASAAGADLGDMLLGDNADVFTRGAYGGAALLKALGTGVSLITTTDTAESTGGIDTITGNAAADVILGGVAGDTLYGDAASPVNSLDGDDVILGDNGKLDFAADRNLLLGLTGTLDLTTLDLIESFTDGLGGVDTISGNAGADTAMGGTAGDTIYGDNATADGGATDKNDLLLGDNGYVWLVSPVLDGSINGADRILVLGGAVALVRSTDEPAKGPNPSVSSDTGGIDTISGNAGGDIILGGVQGDTLYGDCMVVTTATNSLDGRDIILGDNGALEWLSTGRLDEITGIEVAAQNDDLVNGFATRDANLDTLDLVTTEQPTNGGRDTIYGDNARDVIFGGTDADTLYGDTGSETDGLQSVNGNDLMFGDHGRLYPQFSRYMVNGTLVTSNDIYARNFFAIDVGDTAGGEGDRMWGEEGADIMLGQQGDDRMWGGSGDDDMIGGHNVAGGYDELSITTIAASLNPAISVPGISTVNDLMDGGTGNDSMAGDNAIIWRRGDDLSPRFRALTAASIYTTTANTITANVGGTWQSDPADAVGRDIQLLDHSDAVQTTPLGRFGNDVMAGGADSDVMFGQLGNDLMQGDGYLQIGGNTDGATTTQRIDVTDSAAPSTAGFLFFKVPEATTDGDDYLEGNGGSDLMYGGLGQDDMIGGSSALFGLTDETMRPDTSDTIFGGAGIAIARNDIGATTFGLASEDATTHVITTSADGHARDADFIMGDNANVYRLVTGGPSYPVPANPADAFLTFDYDNYGTLKIIPRAMQQLDYTLGGGDYAGDGYNADGQATPTGKPADNGAADLIHGESGDDFIFGMTGSDVIFGEGQDDDIVGGYGNDWISGGTGQDGVLGDDGLIYTSRNSTTGEPLNNVAGLLASDPRPKYADGNVLDEVIKTPGELQYAVINISGQLKKTVDLVPLSYDPAWNAMDDEFPDNQGAAPYADDIIFGGLGSDWLHGGSGDDAISGAEALPDAYVPTYNDQGIPNGILNLGYNAVGLPSTTNPGNVLAFNPVDLDGQHLNNRFRAGEFALYDEYDPLRKIMLDKDGNLWKSTAQGDAYEFLLNFNKAEGVVRPAGTVPKATGQQTDSYPQVNDDGKDAIFGDLGNDWLVGGTGRDNLYGGWGNDLLNADDDHTTNGGLNDQPDTHPYYEDRAYGGAGRDILIGNTGGDRLIDWVGEYNSYLVPYAPFGQASVSRTMMPFLHEFLYSLSAGDGADPTRFNDTGADPLRNGEPDAELGLVLQKDFAWQAQTGAPADPQAGNIPGGKRDVLRSANFNDGTAQGFTKESGTWTMKSGVYYVEPTVLGSDAVSLWNHDQALPSYFEITATVNPVKPIAGYKANGYIVFDYYGPDDFKFAGLNSSNNKVEIGQRTAAGWQVLASSNMIIKAGSNYNLLVALNGTNATLVVDNKLTLSYSFTPRVDNYGMRHNFNDGMIGLGADNAKAAIDNVNLQVIPPSITLTRSEDFSKTPELLAGKTGTWEAKKGYYVGTPSAGQSLALASGDLKVGPAYLLQLETKISTAAAGGIVFDQYNTNDFKWVVYSKATNQILLGHYTKRTGWVIDKSISRTLSGDVTLSLTLKGSTVSVLVNGTAALSHVYNAVVTDGGFGLLAKDGTASFDWFTVRSDDPRLAP